MAEYTTGNTSVRDRTKINNNTDKKLAGDYLAEKGYERHAKPRQVNGGKDRLPDNYAARNKARMNSALVNAPAQTRTNSARVQSTVKKNHSKQAGARVKVTEVRREKPATPFPMFAIICILSVVVISLYVIHLYIELDEIDATITQCNNRISEMKNEERVLQTQKVSKYDLEEIERIAKDKYGMVDADQLPKEYITPNTGDSIEIMETDKGEETPDVLLSGFAGVVSELLSYIN